MPNQRANTFRFKGKNIFLTYSRVDQDWPLPLLLDWYKNLDYGTELQKVLVARELHKDGTPHFHVFLGLQSQFNTRQQRFFDYDGKHPNIQSARSAKCVTTYCTKDGNYLAEQRFGDVWEEWEIQIKVTFKDALGATSRDEFLDLAASASARDYILSYDKIVSFADTKFASQPLPYDGRPRDAYTEDNIMSQWVTDQLETVRLVFFWLV